LPVYPRQFKFGWDWELSLGKLKAFIKPYAMGPDHLGRAMVFTRCAGAV
jgi:hypothetical protein